MAILTTYQGITFRSRTEAKWAVFFDHLNIPYKYELEGYAENGIAYLPDFFLEIQDCFIEIKPTSPSKEEIDKAWIPVETEKKDLFFLCGTPQKYIAFGLFPEYLASKRQSDERGWAHCPECDVKGLVYFGATEKLNCCNQNPGHSLAGVYQEKMDEAIRLAENYRFGKIA